MSSQRSRGVAYSDEEINCLLESAEKHQPISRDEWQLVWEDHQVHWMQTERTLESLRKKFQSLANMRPPTGDPSCPPHVRWAKRIMTSIKMDSGYVPFHTAEEASEEDHLTTGVTNDEEDGDFPLFEPVAEDDNPSTTVTTPSARTPRSAAAVTPRSAAASTSRSTAARSTHPGVPTVPTQVSVETVPTQVGVGRTPPLSQSPVVLSPRLQRVSNPRNAKSSYEFDFKEWMQFQMYQREADRQANAEESKLRSEELKHKERLATMKMALDERKWEREEKRKDAEQKMMNNLIISMMAKDMRPSKKTSEEHDDKGSDDTDE